MRIKCLRIIYFILLISFGTSCNRRGQIECVALIKNVNNDAKLFLSLKNTSDNCLFKLSSNFYSNVDSLWYLKISKERVYVSMNSTDGNENLLFHLSDPIGKKRHVKASIPNWIESKGDELILKDFEVELVNKLKDKDCTYYVLKFYEAVYMDLIEKNLDAYVFFSTKEGFIGSYFYDPIYPTHIIQRAGNILEDKMDYSKRSFMRLR